MQTPTKHNLLLFSVKNLKYALRKEDGSGWDTPKPLAYAESLSIEPDFQEQVFYGDGEKLLVLPDDKGYTGEIIVTTIEDHYEIDMGRSLKIAEGNADVQQLVSVPHCIYYEVLAYVDGVQKVYKAWLMNCRTGRASETYQQTKEDPTVNYYSYPLTVMGDFLKDATGVDLYIDENGNTKKIYRVKSKPGDPGYDTFGDNVPTLTNQSAG